MPGPLWTSQSGETATSTPPPPTTLVADALTPAPLALQRRAKLYQWRRTSLGPRLTTLTRPSMDRLPRISRPLGRLSGLCCRLSWMTMLMAKICTGRRQEGVRPSLPKIKSQWDQLGPGFERRGTEASSSSPRPARSGRLICLRVKMTGAG